MSELQIEAKKSEPRALTVRGFLERYNIRRDLFYDEVKAGRIKLRKAGQRSLIAIEDAEAWFANLPTVQPRRLTQPRTARARRRVCNSACEPVRGSTAAGA